jgi:hypothetical protein
MIVSTLAAPSRETGDGLARLERSTVQPRSACTMPMASSSSNWDWVRRRNDLVTCVVEGFE